ncbi:MAG: A/G-specific adenine glycosylase [Halofilum sp. (in: g-proteobacteria)]
MSDGRDVAERVLAWYERHGRHDLPWQRPASPYRVWISEIMLQQTRVETVRPYFERFMERFPDVATLAAADVGEVLEHWAGLGYYARARNLHRAAQRMADEHGGSVPADYDALIALPGIGRSTAGAILSLAGGQRQAILDGNVKRVLARHIGLTEWPGGTQAQKRLWTEAEVRTPRARVAEYNQAMMDLGATVCLRRPRCEACPVRSDCRAYRDEVTDAIPAPKPRRAVPQRETVALVLQRPSDRAILLERRPPTGIWGGLWSLPEFDDEERLQQWLAARLGDVPAEALAAVEHAFTHFRLRIHPRRVFMEPPAAIAEADAHGWYAADMAPGGLPAPIRRLADRLVRSTLG